MANETWPTVGMTMYVANRTELRSVHGFDDDGLFVTTHEGFVGMSVEHEHTGREFGEVELMWRCSDYGEMGDLDELPNACPNCGAEREQLHYWTED